MSGFALYMPCCTGRIVGGCGCRFVYDFVKYELMKRIIFQYGDSRNGLLQTYEKESD
jgi:hypothetical protein